MRRHEHNRQDEDDDDEEETVELRVAASRQDDATRPKSVIRQSISRLTRFPSSSTFVSPFGSESPSKDQANHGETRHHSIHFGEPDTRPTAYSISTGPLIEKLTTLVSTGAGVLSTTTQMVGLDSVADSVAEAMSLLQNPFGVHGRRKDGVSDYLVNPKLGDAKEQRTRLKLQAFWQLLLTGFEVQRFSVGKRAKTQVLWMDLGGKLYLDVTKKERHATKCMFWPDVELLQKGSEAECFTKSLSWRDAKAKAHLSFSLHGRHGKEERVFAMQVLQSNVRNVLVDNFEALLRLTKGDADGEFPFAAQKVIAQHYAMSGDVLTLRQVEDVLLREEDERFATKSSSNGGDSQANTDKDGGEDNSSSDESDEDQRNILG